MKRRNKHNDACDSVWLYDDGPAEFGEVPFNIEGFEFSPNTKAYVKPSYPTKDMFEDKNTDGSVKNFCEHT